MQTSLETVGSELRELSATEVDEVGGGVIFLMLGYFGAGVVIGAGIYLATEYLT